MKAELFMADCKLCQRTLQILKQNFPELKLILHKSYECKDGSCCKLAESYGIKAVPSLVIDGKVIFSGLPGQEELRKLKEILSKTQ